MTEVIFPEEGARGSEKCFPAVGRRVLEGVSPEAGVGALEGVAAGRRLPFFLAAEEYLARRELPAGEEQLAGREVRPEEQVMEREGDAGAEGEVPASVGCRSEGGLLARRAFGGGLFFLWQSGPTVIFGRNQDPEAELDTRWCRAHGVEYYRRKSGGGCVYSDRGNIMISCIYPGSGVQENFAKFSEAVCGALRSLGLPAEVSGRNDILIDGRKVSGSAFFALPSSSVVHSTMLYDIDFASMEAALRPSRLKLGAKGVRSVSSRVCSVREFLPELPIERLAEALRRALSAGGGRLLLDAMDITKIERIEQSYLEEDFIGGKFSSCVSESIESESYVEGCGYVEVSLKLRRGKIFNVSLVGDFFAVGEDVSEELSRLLAGRRPVREEVEAALEGVAIEKMVRGLSARAFVDILFKNA